MGKEINIEHYHVCIIGAGTSGMAAAYALKDSKYKVALIEKQKMLGGTATNGWVESWIEGITPPYLEKILEKDWAINIKSIRKTWIPDRYARKKGVRGFSIPSDRLARTYKKDMDASKNIVTMCGYTFKKANVQDRTIKSIFVSNVVDPSDEREIVADYFIDCSGSGVLGCYNGKIDVDFLQGEDPYERFEESLIPKNNLTPEQRHKILNEPSLFFKVQKKMNLSKDQANNTDHSWSSSVDSKYRIISQSDYIFNGYNTGTWVNPMTGMNIAGWAVIELGEEKVYQMAVENISGYWNFIHSEIYRRLKDKLSLYGFNQSTTVCEFNGIYAPMLGIREGRRVCCEYMLRQDDLTKLISSANLKSDIACGSHIVDFHIYGSLDFSKISEFNKTKIRPSGIPYECLIPRRFNNVLVACRAFGASHIALAARRVNKDMAQLGWAAGNATKMCLMDGLSDTREVDVSVLQSNEFTGFKSAVVELEKMLDLNL